jgi:tRNA dimethylallyltransferase
VEIVAIVGSTGTGKSELALGIAHALGDCEIINADAFAQYIGMDIGTAKVMPTERQNIPHHMIDILDPMEVSSIAQYQEAARPIISDILARGRRPVVVGGSGLYVRALLDEMELPGSDPEIRAALEQRYQMEGLTQLFQELQQSDPTAAARIGPQNARRIIRALEVITLTGKPYTATLPQQEYVSPTIQIGIDYGRDSLDNRIDQRVELMRERGLLTEVAHLTSGEKSPSLGPTAARAIGYAELLPVLAGAVEEADAFAQIATHTKQLTRKQMTWFGRDPRVTWLDGAAPNLLDQALAVVAQGYQAPAEDNPPQLGDTPRQRTPLGSVSASVSGMYS